MTAADLVLVVTTHPESGAESLARSLVESRVAACVQTSTVRSTYRWKGAIEATEEVRLECKTTRERADACIAAIRERHPYEVPEILVVPILEANAPYAEWVDAETRAQ
jgi:periplasmic divalent cation tolerance protein